MAKPIRDLRADWSLGLVKSGIGYDAIVALKEDFACVVYEADENFQITHMSANASELLGIEPKRWLKTTSLYEDRVALPDRSSVKTRLNALRISETAAFVHRLIDDEGTSITVAHALKRFEGGYRGSLIPVDPVKPAGASVDIEVVSEFIHKIGNHFQLLNLMFDSFRRNGANPNNLTALQQTAEAAIGLTRNFSNYLQPLPLATAVNLPELVESVVDEKRDWSSDKSVAIELRSHLPTGEPVIVSGDGAFLGQAIGAIIENAIEATPANGSVLVELGPVPQPSTGVGLASITVRIVDSGPGLSEEQAKKAGQPFHTTKAGHDGLGLSRATRCINLHGGLIQYCSVERRGTEVNIVLPVTGASGRLDGEAVRG